MDKGAYHIPDGCDVSVAGSVVRWAEARRAEDGGGAEDDGDWWNKRQGRVPIISPLLRKIFLTIQQIQVQTHPGLLRLEQPPSGRLLSCSRQGPIRPGNRLLSTLEG